VLKRYQAGRHDWKTAILKWDEIHFHKTRMIETNREDRIASKFHQCFVNLGPNTYILSPIAQQPLVDQGLPLIQSSRSHSDTPHSVRLLWTSDQPDAETSTWQHTTLIRDRHSNAWRNWSLNTRKLQIHAIRLNTHTTVFFSRTWCFQLSAELQESVRTARFWEEKPYWIIGQLSVTPSVQHWG